MTRHVTSYLSGGSGTAPEIIADPQGVPTLGRSAPTLAPEQLFHLNKHAWAVPLGSFCFIQFVRSAAHRSLQTWRGTTIAHSGVPCSHEEDPHQLALMFSGWKKSYRDFDIGEQVGFAGTHALWQLYNAVYKKTGANATIWVLEKKPIEKEWFKKDPVNFKKFMNYMVQDTKPTGGIVTGLRMYEDKSEDGSYISFATERVIGSLLSLYFIMGDLTLAKNKQFHVTDQQEIQKYQQLLRYTSPDSVIYGLTTVFDDLQQLHTQQVVHGNITPANIVITEQGEWRLCGNMFSQNSVFQFEFNNDENAWFRPSAAFMTPKQASGKYSNAQTDCAQVFNSVFAVFGNRVPHYDFSKDKREKMPAAEQLIIQVSEKICGVCPPGIQYGLNPQNALQHANLNERFWKMFASQINAYYPLQYFGSIMPIISQCASESSTAPQVLSQLRSMHQLCELAFQISQICMLGGFSSNFNQETNTKITQLLSATLPSMINSLTVDFLQSSLLGRVVSLMSCKDYHQYIIPCLIQMNTQLLIPYNQLFLLFEPIVIAETLTSCRSVYQQAGKGAFAAFQSVQLDILGDSNQNMKPIVCKVKYTSPYNNDPLDSKMREKDRDRFCPNFDQMLNDQTTNLHHCICACIYKNLQFFFSPKVGGRSHYYTLNLVMGCISCQNSFVSGDVIKYLADAVGFMNDSHWMMEEQMLASQKVAQAMSNLGNQISQGFNKNVEDDEKKKQQGQKADYKQPITTVLTPCIGNIIKTSTNGQQIHNALICMATISNYFTDDQISRIMLPAINDALDNISKYAKAIVGFAQFSKLTKNRYIGKTVAVMHLPRLLRMCYADDITGADLNEIRMVCEELFQYINSDIQQRINGGAGQQQPQKIQQGQQDSFNQPAVDQYGHQNNYNPYSQPATTGYDYSQQPADPYAGQFNVDYNYDYNQGQGQSANDNPLDW